MSLNFSRLDCRSDLLRRLVGTLSSCEELKGSDQSEFRFILILPSICTLRNFATAAACAFSTLWVTIQGSFDESPALHCFLLLHLPAVITDHDSASELVIHSLFSALLKSQETFLSERATTFQEPLSEQLLLATFPRQASTVKIKCP